MKIIIDEKARKLLEKNKTSAIYVFLGGCRSWGGGVIPQPAVNVGTPKDTDSYNTFEVDDITVYVRKDTKTKNDELTISTVKILWIDNLTVEGMEY